MHVIEVSNHYGHRVVHGLWRDKDLAERTAGQWNRAFERRGWPLRATVYGMLAKTASARDQLGELLADLAVQAGKDEMLRATARVCECEGLRIAAGSVDDTHPDGVCECDHEPNEHDGELMCGGMVLPEVPVNPALATTGG